MKRITPNNVYCGKPCSVVAIGTAIGTTEKNEIKKLYSEKLDNTGYLSLRDMNTLIRSKMPIIKQEKFKRGERPLLRDFAKDHKGKKAIICVLGHYLYFDGKDYHSFLWNGGDEVVSVWYIG